MSAQFKTFRLFQRLHSDIGCTNSDVQKRDEQTNRQKNSTFLAAEIRAPTKLGTVTEALEHVLAPLKLLGM